MNQIKEVEPQYEAACHPVGSAAGCPVLTIGRLWWAGRQCTHESWQKSPVSASSLLCFPEIASFSRRAK